MSQASISIANGAGATVRQAINNALQAITTLQSGATAPATTYPYMQWADTANDLLKQRNAANSAWIIKGTLSAEYGGLPASGISYSPGSPALLDADNVQAAIDALAASIGGIPRDSQVFTSSGTFTVPAGVTRIKVRISGGGGEGNSTTGAGNAGGNSSFVGTGVNIAAGGGPGGANGSTSIGNSVLSKASGGAATGGDLNVPGGGAAGGGGRNLYAGGGQWNPIASDGGNAGYCEALLDVTPDEEFTVTIGAGGTGTNGGDGENGWCIVEW